LLFGDLCRGWFSLKHRVILTVCYAAGLRISEAVHLTPAAIDRQRMTIRVGQGKGRKDRYVMLSPISLSVDPGQKARAPINDAVRAELRSGRSPARFIEDLQLPGADAQQGRRLGLRHDFGVTSFG
jgi:integrase